MRSAGQEVVDGRKIWPTEGAERLRWESLGSEIFLYSIFSHEKSLIVIPHTPVARVKTARVLNYKRRRLSCSDASGVSFLQCIAPGLKHKGHRMIKTVGVVAGDAESYETFQEVLESVRGSVEHATEGAWSMRGGWMLLRCPRAILGGLLG